jgi:hypothetical protein
MSINDEELVAYYDNAQCMDPIAYCICACKSGGQYNYVKCGHLHPRFLSKVQCVYCYE